MLHVVSAHHLLCWVCRGCIRFCLGQFVRIKALQILSPVMQEMTGVTAHWSCALEVELVETKRVWLRAFSHPEMLCDDITQCAQGTVYNFMSDMFEQLPAWLCCYTFGYSCKDFSTLNNVSGPWRDECLSKELGTTGKTWRGNLEVVRQTRPYLVLMENVKGAMKVQHLDVMTKELKELGYTLVQVLLNAADCGFPQDRLRAWFLAVRDDVARDDLTLPNFVDLIDAMKLPTHLPLSDFVLAPDHPYLLGVLAQRRALSMKRDQARRNRPRTRPVKTGKKWVLDHWKVRRMLKLLPPPEKVPQHLQEIVDANAMADREADLFRIITDGAMTNSTEQPGLELKHSAPRVVKAKGHRRRRAGSTSCLLPTSRMMLLPPWVPSPRYMTGCEGLAVQGIDHHFTAGDPVLTDMEYLHLAGNAFCGGSCAMILLAGFSFLDLSRCVKDSFL